MTTDFEAFLNAENSEVFAGLFSALNNAPVTGIRLNPHKYREGLLSGLDMTESVPWEATGRYLKERPVFTLDPHLHQGVYYVQDASSMFISEVVRQIARECGNRGLRVLDACAAPGGKTLSALGALPPDSAVIANEYDFKRADVLAENIAKWGDASVAVTRGDTSRFRKTRNAFDLIIADVPCSGEGMFRKDSRAREQWNTGLVQQCSLLQRQIIANLVDALAPGGYLVYSTCTFNTIENECNVEHFSREYGLEPVEIVKPADWNISPAVNYTMPVSRFLPQNVRGEGLFVAVLRKPGELPSPVAKKEANGKNHGEVAGWVEGLITVRHDDRIDGMTHALYALLEKVENKIGGFLSCGTPIALIKGSDIIPLHGLALSQHLRRGAFAECEVNQAQALQFLRRQEVALPDDTPKGYVLLTYNNIPLGFVKNLGTRNNNLLPKEWRIRM